VAGNRGAMPDESGDDDRPRTDTDSSDRSQAGSAPSDATPPEETGGRGERPPEGADSAAADAAGGSGARDEPGDGRREAESSDRPPAAGADRPRPEGSEEHNDVVDFLREVLTSVGTVLLIGAVLFAFSGVWPPLVAVESGSMEPHMFKGDLVFVAENGRYAPDVATAGVVTYQQGQQTGYSSFGDYGNVVVYQPDGQVGTPVIHRAYMYVEEGENWVQRANPEYLGNADTCAENVHCPAPHDGYITRGDDNPRYDQVGGTERETLSNVVKSEWVRGNAKVRVPKLGCIRLELSGIGCEYPVIG